MLFAAYYFGTKKKTLSSIIPLISIAFFVFHPIGRQVWFYSLYWTIPVIINILPKKYSEKTFLKSLGATLTAHSVGSAAWIWTVPMTAAQWVTLVPITGFERLMFALGITISYKGMNLLLNSLITKFKWKIPNDVLRLEKRHIPA
jgi:hypothetical protein